jgi:uncharacterized protein YegP (UPF0339 family)
MKFVLFYRVRGIVRRRREYYFRLVARNGEVIAQSEGYRNAADRDATVRAIRVGARDAASEDTGDGP